MNYIQVQVLQTYYLFTIQYRILFSSTERGNILTYILLSTWIDQLATYIVLVLSEERKWHERRFSYEMSICLLIPKIFVSDFRRNRHPDNLPGCPPHRPKVW